MSVQSLCRTGFALAGVLVLAACNSSSPTQNNNPPPGGNPGVANASVNATPANTFSPNEVFLIVGGTVSFSNSGGLHNVSSGAFTCANGCDGEGGNGSPATNAWSFSRTFPNAGTVNYVCDEHAGVGMTGRIVVQ